MLSKVARRDVERSQKHVRKQLLDYPRKIMQVIIENVPLLDKSMINETFSFSTQYSGMGTAEKAFELVSHEARAAGLSCRPICMCCCDTDPHCRFVLGQSVGKER